ncbi:MAG: transcriptional repressor [Hydrogenophilaceae bacterium]|jgi:Fur family zinc uptake transcriptional regulator|nr:transcriptional repressor [Hydrogenophilaceae bacterium]
MMPLMAHAHTAREKARLLREAERVCAAAGEQFTPLRRQVFELLTQAHAPAKAYDLLAKLGGDAKPPTIYRTLEFLMKLGLVHRIESLNAFVACDVGACGRSTIFLICDRCGHAEEFDAGHALVDLGEAAARDGFEIKRTMIEATGLCAECKAA